MTPPDALTEAHITSQERLRTMAAAGVTAAWAGLPGYDEKDVPSFLARALPVVLGAQRASVALTRAFVARHLAARPVDIDPDRLVGAAVRGGTAPQEVYHRPFVNVWAALKDGTLYEDAVRGGLARAASTAEMDVQLSSRATFAAVAQADTSIRGYQRVPDAGACPYCLAIAGAFVKSADASPLHNRCGCSLVPVTGPVEASPMPAEVAIHEHGELGAVLTPAGQHFTTEHQALAA